MADIPIFSYNEQRPTFIGKDVEGIKSLNEANFQKYNFNKQNYTIMDDALDAMRTIDKDNSYKSEAIDEFQGQFEDIITNGNYEDAGKIMDTAAQKVKRNKALQQSVKNYGTRQEHIQSLKDDPKGWTTEEISQIIGHSDDNYQGVQVDEKGEAYGIYQGYDPGEKINILTELDEGLKGFAADKDFSLGEVQDLIEGGVNKIQNTITKEYINAQDVMDYVNRYYKNDPKINKYYETQAILNSRKGTNAVLNDFNNLKREFNPFGAYAQYLPADMKKDGKVTDEAKLDFMEEFVKDNFGQDISIKALTIAADDSTPEGIEARKQLSLINSVMNRQLDFETATEKVAFEKNSISSKLFKDDIAFYMFKKAQEDTNFTFDYTGSAINVENPFNDKHASKNIDSKLEEFEGSYEAMNAIIKSNEADAVASGKATRDANGNIQWGTEESKYSKLNATYQAQLSAVKVQEKILKDHKLNAEKSFEKSNASNPEYISLQKTIIDNSDAYTEELNQRMNSLNDLINRTRDQALNATTAEEKKFHIDRIAGFNKTLNGIKDVYSGIKSDPYNYEIPNTFENTGKSLKYKKSLKEYSDFKDDRLNEHYKNNSIKGFAPSLVNIDRDNKKGDQRGAIFTETTYRNNKSSYVVLDNNGNVVSLKKYPDEVKTIGISSEPWEDGNYYFQVEGGGIDGDGNFEKKGTYYISATNSSVKADWAKRHLKDDNAKVAAVAYNQLIPAGFNIPTPKVANSPIELYQGDTLFGTVDITSSKDVNGNADFNTVFYNIDLNDNFMNTVNKGVPAAHRIGNNIQASSKTELEQILNVYNQHFINKTNK